MRQWATSSQTSSSASALIGVLTPAIADLGQSRFQQTLLDSIFPLLPAASCSVYRTGPLCEPAIFMSASHGVPDTTLDCWRAYLSGPYRSDRTHLGDLDLPASSGQISHITAQEVPPEHRARVYEAHGVAERVSIVQTQGQGTLFAINFYRHQHQRPFDDAQIGAVEQLAPALLALTHKHLDIRAPESKTSQINPLDKLIQKLKAVNPQLTTREAQVCAGILQGLTIDGIACTLNLSACTVKTYRNRAFDRLGIHFRNELFRLVLAD